ncbi:MAG: TlpA disulfide reductase family protein [Candidatus Sungbacteria bacterium]|nr:TlpA disulfide reductase family protein [bacterium]MDZ4285601.1 TlpA disulfide reductase family protein [Candidatus Sungbacteria bacterium]
MRVYQKPGTIAVIILILIAVAAAGFFIYKKQKQPLSPPVPLRPLPELVFKNYEGLEVPIAAMKGHAILLNAWASWCPFCLKELDDLASLQREYGDRIVVIAVNRGESLETAKKYTEQFFFAGNLQFVFDPSDSFYQSIGGFSMPETIFVDAEGFIRDHKRGPMDLIEMRRRVKQAFDL